MVMLHRAGMLLLLLFHLFVTGALGLQVAKPHGTEGMANALKEMEQALSNATVTATPHGTEGIPGDAPCACQASSPNWKIPIARSPECLFIDLGASDGETFQVFQGKSSRWKFDYDMPGYDHSKCYSYLIEANPSFASKLQSFGSHSTFPMPGVAAYMCDKPQETFYVDVGPQAWGSSLNSTHASVKYNNKAVNVRLLNLMRLLTENALPGDTVVVKMDVEGSEWDILPCLATSPAVKLIDTLYIETHCDGKKWCPSTGQAGNSRDNYQAAIASIKQAGVHVPEYWSPL